MVENDDDVEMVIQDSKTNWLNSVSSTITSTTNSSSNILQSQTIPWGISRVGGAQNGVGKKAWVLDTGIDLNHSDLTVDVYNSVSYVGSESADDLNGHGTHVAGIIAALDNSTQVVGVAAGAAVVSVKVLDEHGNGNTSDVLDGVNYIAGRASTNDIINMSLGAYDPNNNLAIIDDAIINAANSGIRFSIAAGNSSDDAADYSPARVNNSNVWTVSAFRQGDEFAQTFDWNTPNCNTLQNPNVGSNFENPPVDFSGPGESIKSLWNDGGTLTTCGTSMAAPHIAGLLLMNGSNLYVDGTVSGDPDSTPDEIVTSEFPSPILQHSVDNNSPKLTWNSVSGADEYKLYRKFETGSWTLVTTTTGTSYTDTAIYNTNLQTAGSPPFDYEDFYSYKVHAHTNSGAESDPSNLRYFIYPSCSGPGCGS